MDRHIKPDPEKTKAEIAKLKAETDCARNDAALKAAEARKATAEAETSEVELRAKLREEKARLAADDYHQVYAFTDAVTESSVRSCIKQLTEWHRNSPGCGIELVFNSPGGLVIEGLALFDYIQTLRAAGHHITTTALGMAASMAGILLQAGDKRVMGREAHLLIHEVAFGAIGKMGEVEDEVAFAKKLQKRLIGILARRSKLSTRAIARRWRRKDWWLDSEEALKAGFIDEIQGESAKPKRKKAA